MFYKQKWNIKIIMIIWCLKGTREDDNSSISVCCVFGWPTSLIAVKSHLQPTNTSNKIVNKEKKLQSHFKGGCLRELWKGKNPERNPCDAMFCPFVGDCNYLSCEILHCVDMAFFTILFSSKTSPKFWSWNTS